jgi:hypothetical protein
MHQAAGTLSPYITTTFPFHMFHRYDSVVWKYYLEFAVSIRSNSAAAPGQCFVIDGGAARDVMVQQVLACMLKK